MTLEQLLAQKRGELDSHTLTRDAAIAVARDIKTATRNRPPTAEESRLTAAATEDRLRADQRIRDLETRIAELLEHQAEDAVVARLQAEIHPTHSSYLTTEV